MQRAQQYFPDCPEALLVSLARQGDRSAFAEIVKRRQSWLRHLMRSCCGEQSLADDLAQQVFLQVWLKLRGLRDAAAFGTWLRRLAISVWLQHLRKQDVLRNSDIFEEDDSTQFDTTAEAIDLDAALATLSPTPRLCIVLSYQEGMSHSEIAETTDMAFGTVKSHIKRGTAKLRSILTAYNPRTTEVSAEPSTDIRSKEETDD